MPGRDWDSPSASGSWSATGAGSGWNPNSDRGPRSTSQSPTAGESSKRPQILLVEDNTMDVYLIREALETSRVNADLHVVPDGQAATLFVDQADSDPNAPCPNLTLLDLNLPKKSGVEVLKHLRRSARCARSRILIVSSSDAPRDRAAVADLAVSGYFKKPTDYSGFMKLGSLIRDILAQTSSDERK